MQGKDVTIVEMLSELAPTALLDNRNPLMYRLEDHGVKQMTGCKIKEFNDKGAVVEMPDGETKQVEADTVISAFGMKSDPHTEALADKYPRAAVIGDCNLVAQVGGAVRGGFFAGWSIH